MVFQNLPLPSEICRRGDVILGITWFCNRTHLSPTRCTLTIKFFNAMFYKKNIGDKYKHLVGDKYETRKMIRAPRSAARRPLSCFSPIARRRGAEKQNKSLHSSSFPPPPITSTKENLPRPPGMDLWEKWKWETRRAGVGEELQYSLLFPDILISVGAG